MPSIPGAVDRPSRARRAAAAVASVLLAATWAAASVMAQSWPERSITLIVPFAAGGASDVSSRIMAEAMSKQLGQTIVVENVAGAGGSTGSLRGRNAKPDGYTIGFGHMGTHAAAVSTNPKLPYDPRTDYDYLGIHLTTPHLIIVRKDLPAGTLQEFVAYAKEKGKDLKMGHNGLGSLAHLTCAFFFSSSAWSPPSWSIAASVRPSTTSCPAPSTAPATSSPLGGSTLWGEPSGGSASPRPSDRRCCPTCRHPRKADCLNS